MKRILICAIAIVQVFICVSQTTTYSESFTQNITPTSQCTNWNNWRATLDTCYTQVTLSSSLGCSETCTDVSIVRQIIATLIAGGNGSWVYSGKEWYVSNSLGIFIGVFSTIGSSPTQCDSSIVVMRPCIFNASWGGCNHDDCGAPSQTLTLSFSGGLVSSVNTANPVCNGDSSGSATVTPSGGVSPYTYQWDVNTGSQTTATATGLQSGTYYVTITDNYGCQISDTVVVSDPPLLTWTTDSTDETCAGDYSGSATVNITNGASPYTYAWDANTGNQTTSTATGLTTGTYYVTIADDNGCSKTDSVSVNSPAPLSATMSSTPVLCYGDSNGTASALASGGVSPYTYQWDANTGNQTTSTATGLTAGTYYVTITDNNGCSKTDSVSITSPAPLSATMGSTAVLCYGDSNGTASALASGGVSPYTYQWDANTGNQTTSTATGLLAGTYLVTITDDNGCTKEDSITIASPQPINSTVNSVSLLCNGDSNGTATAINSGGVSPYSYQWDGNAGSQTTATATGLQAGTYYITITDMNGCTVVDSITITQPQVLTLSIATIDDNGGCTGSATATVGGGTSPYAYQWDDSNNQTDQTATGLCAGLYCVTVTDSNACTVFSCDSVIVGIAHLEKSGGFTVYPNPGSGQLTLLNSSSVDYDALVMDVSGRVLMIVRDVHSRTTHLDLSSFGKGVYLIAIKEQDGRSEVLLYVLE